MAAMSMPEPEASSRDTQAEALVDDDDLVLSTSTLAALQARCLQTCISSLRSALAKAACCLLATC